MTGFSRLTVILVALATYLASIAAMVRGGFVYPVELGLVALIALLLVAVIAMPNDDAASSLVSSIFFLSCMANIAYLYSVSGYLSTVRLGALGLSFAGLALSATSLMAQPVPTALTSEAKNLIAAGKRLSLAKERLQAVKEEAPPRATSRKAKPRKRK